MVHVMLGFVCSVSVHRSWQAEPEAKRSRGDEEQEEGGSGSAPAQAPPPEEPVPFAILVTWALILVTTAALLWWQSVSFQRAQRAKEIRAVEEVRGRGESGAC